MDGHDGLVVPFEVEFVADGHFRGYRHLLRLMQIATDTQHLKFGGASVQSLTI